MLFYIYSDAPGSTIDITSRCRVGRLQVKDQAEEGAVAISSLIIDDPDGDLEITGHRRMYIYESDAPIFDQVIFNGFVVNERVMRGPYRTGAGRQWVVDLADPNVHINRRIMNGADANRPAETDLARIQALLTMTELNTVDDDTYVNTTAATTAMDAADYRGQNVGAYIDDCRQASGKNGYILYNETVGQYGLWYDFASSVVYDSGCFLSNTIGEPNGTTVFAYSQERTYLNRDPSRVASGIYLEWSGGAPVYVQDATTTAAFAAIDWAAPSVNVKTVAKATARAERYLADAATEHRLIHTVMTSVPRASVNKIKKGQLVSFKASWMPGFEFYTVCRVLNRTVTEISEDPQNSFEIEMDLDPQGEPANVYMFGFLTQRSNTTYGASIVPRGSAAGIAPFFDPWTHLGSGYCGFDGPFDYPFDVAYLGVGGNAHPLWTWGGDSGLNGSSRPTGHSMQIRGACGPPVILEQLNLQFAGSTLTAPTATAPADGIMFALFSGRKGGDPSGSAFTLVTPSDATIIANTMASANPLDTGFFPRAWLGYKVVTSGQQVDWQLSSNMTVDWGCMVVFIPGGADLSIVEFVLTGTIGSALSWGWVTDSESIDPGVCTT